MSHSWSSNRDMDCMNNELWQAPSECCCSNFCLPAHSIDALMSRSDSLKGNWFYTLKTELLLRPISRGIRKASLSLMSFIHEEFLPRESILGIGQHADKRISFVPTTRKISAINMATFIEFAYKEEREQ